MNQTEIAEGALRLLREHEPLVLALTNTVAANFTANCLLALGAKPAMMEEPAEAAELARSAGAVLVNVGTVTGPQAATMRAAVVSANAAHVPWVLDPVAHHVLAFRRGLVAELLRERPALVRGNAAEIAALPPEAECTVTLATGPVDEIRAPERPPLRIPGGDAMLTRVTATGCAQGAVCAAFCAVVPPYEAAVAASVTMKHAGEAAAERGRGRGPGSFAADLIDALWGLGRRQDARGATVK